MRVRIRVFIAAAICFGAAMAYLPKLPAQVPKQAGQVSALIPAVSIDRGGLRLVAQAHVPVFWRDVVATQRLARARIVLGDGSILNVGSNSTLRIIQHDAQAQQTQLRLIYGRVRAKVAHLSRPGAKFEIHTRVATIGVVGTDFFAQQGNGGAAPGAKIDVAILPFTAAPGSSASEANAEALAAQLRDQLAQSGHISADVIAPPEGVAGPIGRQDAAHAGQAADAQIVILPVIEQAQAKEIQKGFGGGFGHFHIPAVGGRLKHVAANVQLQVRMIRSADASALKTFDVASKKDVNGVNLNAAGYSTDLGSVDVTNPNFQKSPLGQALAEAMSKLAVQVQSQATEALKQAAAAAPAAPPVNDNIATVVDFKGLVHFCNLRQQCVNVGPGMMSTIRDEQPPDPPHPAPQSVIQNAKQSTEVAPAIPRGPVQTASAPGPSAPAPPSAPSVASGSATQPTGGFAIWNFALRPFSATEIITSKGQVVHMKYYSMPGAMRMEMEQKGHQTIMITRTDRGLMWMVMPQQKMYMEINLKTGTQGFAGMAGQSSVTNAVRMPDAKFDRTKIGAEQLGPYLCDKYRYTVTSEGKTYRGIMWAARQLNGFPVKWLDEKTGATVEFRDIDLGPQNPSLFEPPPGYRKMTMPSMGHP